MAKQAAKTDDEASDEAPGKPASSSKKKLIVIVIAALALVGVSVGGTLLAGKLLGKDEPVKKVAKKKAADAGEEQEAEAKDEGDKAEGDKPEGEDKAEAEGETNPDGSPKLAAYLDFDQPFVVNFQDEGQLRYLQIGVSVMATDPKAIEEVKRHMPHIRNNLVMLFSGLTRELALTREGKEKIRTDAQGEVQKILKDQTGQAGIKSLFFTSFVMQ
jgi:flagellar FliL protein